MANPVPIIGQKCDHRGTVLPVMLMESEIVLQLPEQEPRRQVVSTCIRAKCLMCGLDINFQPPPKLSDEELEKYGK